MEHLMEAAKPRPDFVAAEKVPAGTPITQPVLNELIARIRRLREAMSREMDSRPGETA